MIGNLIAAIIIGFIAGFIGRALLPGPDPMGVVATIVVGIVGALVGWVLFTYVLGIGDDDKFDLGGISARSSGRCSCCSSLRAVRGRETAPCRAADRPVMHRTEPSLLDRGAGRTRPWTSRTLPQDCSQVEPVTPTT